MEPNLPIYGLARPLMGCSLTENAQASSSRPLSCLNRISQNPSNVDEEVIINEAIEKFLSFLDYMRIKGVPEEMLSSSLKRLEYFALLGHEPTIGELLGMHYTGGLAGGPSQDDIVVAGTIAAGGDPQTGKLIASIIPKDFFNNTFGAVFANGFNLSCWNSTFTPAKVSDEVSRIHVPFFTSLLEDANSSSSTLELESKFNYLLKAVDISFDMYANKMLNGANWRSCSKEAIQIYIDIVTGAKQQTEVLLANLKKKFNISISTNTVPAKFTYPKDYTGQPQDFTWSEVQHGNSTYRIIKFNERIEDSISLDGSSNGQQQAGFGIGLMLLIAGIGFGIWKATKNNALPN